MSDVLKKFQIESSYIPKRYLLNKQLHPTTTDISAFDKLSDIANRVADFVSGGHNLLLYSGNCGNGKTSWACKIALKYIDYSCNYAIKRPVLFVNAAEYINKKKSAINDRDLIEEMNTIDRAIYDADLVIWDDVAVKALSEYDKEQLYVFINNRISNMKSNIFTTNCSIVDMERILGPRLKSRLVNNSICIELVGSDFRRDEF